jgi:hypothetical protein
MTQHYQRIVYPERAEYLRDESTFRGYKIFLEHWEDITKYLQEAYEVLRVRRFSKSLVIYGTQGCGKSVLADKIYGDFRITQAASAAGIQYDRGNIWHRITAGSSDKLYTSNIATATAQTVILQAENRRTWVDDAIKVVEGNKDRSCLVIADNCERDYFLQGLLNVSDDAYLSYGRSDAAMRMAANRFVELCRTSLRGCFFIFFTNNEDFALTFDRYVNEQHKDLVDIRDLRMPNDVQKEAIVRINVSRLNPFSYWFCLDRAGPDEKKNAWATLRSAETFPASFASVDNAIRSSTKVREGKPARKCVLNAFVLIDAADASAFMSGVTIDDSESEDVYLGKSIAIRQFKSGWSKLFGGLREYRMLESEWNLKVVLAANPFVSGLLAGDAKIKSVIEQALTYHAPGTHNITKSVYGQSIRQSDDDLVAAYASVSNAAFWVKGSLRNHDYETRLKAFYPEYNTKTGGLLDARPDLVVAPYVPCSILSSKDDMQANLNAALRRDGNVAEFTAIKEFSIDKLVAYLRDQKMKNYVSAVQEQ